MRGGRIVPGFADGLEAARRRAAEAIAGLPARLLSHAPEDPPYPVGVSAVLEQHHARVRSSVT